MTYFRNLWLWLSGFGKLGRIAYKPGWGPWRFLPWYLLDVGLAVLVLAWPVTTISWGLGHYSGGTVWRWLAKVLDRLDHGHVAKAGGPLWGSKECSKPVRIAVPVGWGMLILWGCL